MKRLFSIHGFAALVAVAFMNAFVDLGHKIVVQNTIFKVYDGGAQIALTGVVNALILLPFILLLSPAGFISDRFAKPKVIRFAAAAAIVITILITLCYHMGWFWVSFGLTLMLAIQSAIYGPAKLGYIKEVVGVDNLAAANGVVQAATTAAILAGMLAFSFGFESLVDDFNGKSSAEILPAIASLGWFLIAGSIVEFLLALRLPERRGDDRDLEFDFARYRRGQYLAENLSTIWRRPVLRLSVIGLAIFWSIAQVLIAVYPTFAENFLAMANVATIQLIMAAASIGVVVGSVLAARLSRAHIETGFIPIGAAGVAVSLLFMLFSPSAVTQAGLFFALGVAGALFIVPLNALIQYNADDDELGRVLAASSFINNLTMIGFLGLTVYFALHGFSDSTLLVLLTVIAVAGTGYTVYKIPQSLVRLLIARLFALRYRLNVSGMQHIPREGGVLLLGNHISWIDWAIVAMASPRPIRFVMARSIYERWYLRWFLDFVGVIPIAPGQSVEALADIGARLNAGEVICLFPEGTISRHGQLNDFRPGFEKAVANVEPGRATIVPFYLRGLWGSQFSQSSEGLKRSTPLGRRRDITVAFGRPLPLAATAPEVKQAVAELSIDAWQDYVETLEPLAQSWLRTTRRRGGEPAIIESSGRTVSRNLFAAVTLSFARLISGLSKGRTIGIMLPPGIGGAAANLAGLLTGKTVVNLNYTASSAALAAAIDKAGITEVYSAQQFLKKLSQRGIEIEPALGSARLVDLEDLRARIKPWHITWSWLQLKLLPVRLLARLYGAERDPNEPAVILFSSGSEGLPKGVVLSHRNVLANIRQTADMLNPVAQDVMVSSLPLFHAFGLTATTLLPLIEGIPMLAHPDPTDVTRLAKAIYRHRATIMCGTSTFFRFYLRQRRVLPMMLESLRIVVAGAERLDDSVREGFATKFGKQILEGYGATETTPVASVNVPDYLDPVSWKLHAGQKPRTVGLPLPGSCFRVVDPETNETLPPDEDGMILIGGVQVMRGYLDDQQRTDEAIIELDGRRWYRTGDKGHLDKEGFLTIVDRYSRFAKLGGEMVSLSAVESGLKQAFGDDFEVVVVAVPDSKKGERLVALTKTGDGQTLDVSRCRSRCQESGMNALMIPDTWLEVDELPLLGSGKTDFAAARKLALAG